MLVSGFDYSLPPELIAQRPLPHRDDSRMMVIRRREKEITHARFRDLPEFFRPGDVLVLNAIKVIPAKTWGKVNGREVEFLFLEEIRKGVWEVLCRPAKMVRPGREVVFSAGLKGEVEGQGSRGKRLLHFSSGVISKELSKIGYAPLPPYIKRGKGETGLRAFDLERYQTVFARRAGAIAAPTAGLHFTPETLALLKARRVQVCRVNLKVGQATFQPVEAEVVEDHRMLAEAYSISASAAEIINRAKKAGRPVAAVGTTVVRTLESAWRDGRFRPGTRSTEMFIFPGFKFKVVDRLLTNFHLPKSTLLMLVAAFAGKDLVLKAYSEAVRERYRFFSYGDCMLIL